MRARLRRARWAVSDALFAAALLAGAFVYSALLWLFAPAGLD